MNPRIRSYIILFLLIMSIVIGGSIAASFLLAELPSLGLTLGEAIFALIVIIFYMQLVMFVYVVKVRKKEVKKK